MGSTFGPDALPYPQPTDAPDGPGAFLALVQALMTGGPVAQDTLAHLQAITGKFLNKRGVVYNDAGTPSNNGEYRWNGTTWVPVYPDSFLGETVGGSSVTFTTVGTNYILTDSPVTFTLRGQTRVRVASRYQGGVGSAGEMFCGPAVVAGSSATLSGATIGSLRPFYVALAGGAGFTEGTAEQTFLLAAGTYTAFTVGQSSTASSTGRNSITAAYAVGTV